MKANAQTIQQVDRAIRKVAEKFPLTGEATLLTDIHLRVNQETGELLAFDDEDKEINRCVVEQWIDNKDDDFFDEVAAFIRKRLHANAKLVDNLGILKPYAFVLEDEEKEPIAELYVADDDTVILSPIEVDDLEKDLDDFLKDLLKD
jgi:hypothetical protein